MAEAVSDISGSTKKLNLYGGWRAAFPFLLPSLIGFFFFFLLPTGRGIYLSFTDWNLLANSGDFIGAENYDRLFDDSLFWKSVRVTIWYVVINIVTQTLLAIGIAVVMDRLTKSAFVRAVVLLPYLIPNVIVTLLFVWLLDPSFGIINEFIASIPIIGFESTYFTSIDGVIPTIAAVMTWRHMGYTALLIFAGLQTIPKSLYEAAALDGASELQILRRITVPLLRPVLALVLVITVIGSFQVFDAVQVGTGGFGGRPGGPINQSRVIYLYIFENAFNFNDLGYASAISVVLLVVLMIVTAFQLKILRAGESDLA